MGSESQGANTQTSDPPPTKPNGEVSQEARSPEHRACRPESSVLRNSAPCAVGAARSEKEVLSRNRYMPIINEIVVFTTMDREYVGLKFGSKLETRGG